MNTIRERLLEQRERDAAIDVLELQRSELRQSQTRAWIRGLRRLADESTRRGTPAGTDENQS